jgi:hypothetical protein
LDDQTLANWRKIKETFEASGNTDNMFYKRALVILKGQPDPLDKLFGNERKGSTSLD